MIVFLIIIGFIFYCVSQTLFWVGLWQTKEYRLDRIIVHIKETHQGRQALFNYTSLSLFLLVGIYILGSFNDTVFGIFPFLVLTFFAVQTAMFFYAIYQHRVKRPLFTVKSFVIVLLTFLGIGVLYEFPLTVMSFWFIALAYLIPLVVVLFVFFFSFPTEIYTDILMQRAKKKMQHLKGVKVIAVSGSYGKSSTKEAVAHILSQKYTVVKTKLSNNTPIAIARTILREVTPSTDFFIVETGAYKKGEIAQICLMISPDISITTSVSDQHLSLYGTIDDVISSEMELIYAMNKKGISLFNKNSPLTQKIADSTKHEKVFYQTTASSNKSSKEIIGFDISAKKNGVAFSAKYRDKFIHLFSPLLGIHTVENILPAIFLGIHFGLTDNEIIHGVKTLTPLPKTMVQKKLPGGVIAVDDTFNASPESVMSAAEYLKLYKKKRIFVMTPLIELGKMGKQRHRQIGEELSVFDYVFLTNKNFAKQIEEGINSAHGKTIVEVAGVKQIAQKIKMLLQKDDAVVFEGKEAGFVLKYLL